FSLLLHLLAVQAASHGSVGNGNDDDDSALMTSCLAAAGVRNVTTRRSPAYAAALAFSVQNLRFAAACAHHGPAAVVVPASLAELRAAVLCAREAGLVVRLRSGGHSYEGLSYTTDDASGFVVIDLVALDRVRVDAGTRTAWVQSGATLGQVYHAVAASSKTLAFSAGSCPTVGSGGHIAGGGFGLLSRKYGLAADNVIDALLVDADGRVLDRDGMGEEVFWAIRGGGGGTWGTVYAWRVKLSPVPERVTVFVVNRPGTVESVARLVSTWQHVAPWLPDEFYLSAFVGAGLPESDGTGISVTFKGFYLGRSQEALEILSARAISFLSKQPKAYVILDPYGGAMDRIAAGDLPFPHRKGNIHGIQHLIAWTADDDDQRQEYMDWLRRFYDLMGAYVSNGPRTAYINYLDLDLGTNNNPSAAHPHHPIIGDDGSPFNSEVEASRTWGERYFLSNYDRLVRAKTTIDPENVFRNAQSIPPLFVGALQMTRRIAHDI
uniref:FAD-binding PCMH-type domain-containing protein n=1 Tax=Aegilops tauschii subsp. strangulata TaxID=200361 RepID=A0A453A089_AEGTS